MKLLLDTHVWLWSRLEPQRLSRRAARALENSANTLWLSPISAWEIVLLADRGRIRPVPDAVSWIRASLATMTVTIAPIDIEVAVASHRIALPHADPADRLLAATAKLLDLTLVTADERLLGCREVRTLKA